MWEEGINAMVVILMVTYTTPPHAPTKATTPTGYGDAINIETLDVDISWNYVAIGYIVMTHLAIEYPYVSVKK